jgi:hypothetical protein
MPGAAGEIESNDNKHLFDEEDVGYVPASSWDQSSSLAQGRCNR